MALLLSNERVMMIVDDGDDIRRSGWIKESPVSRAGVDDNCSGGVGDPW